MRTFMQVLSPEEKDQVHERTLKILANVGVRVDTAKGRQYLKDAGAEVDENTNIVRFPRELVEESLKLAPKKLTLGARRPDWDLQLNNGDCHLLVDGEATFVIDRETGEQRPGKFNDWLNATHLIDGLDDIAMYWSMIESGQAKRTTSDMFRFWRTLFGNFSKHIQNGITNAAHAPYYKDVLQAIFGDKETIRKRHPISFLICPQSPLIIEEQHTDAYLEMVGYDIPTVIMPMPMMGATAPGSMIGTVIQGNCEVLSMLCLIQAAAPGNPVLYSPSLAIINPRDGRYAGGAIEGGLLSVAAVEMGRYYNLPVENTGIGTDHFMPGMQVGYEKSMTTLLQTIAWPDILMGAGLLGSATLLSLEQIIIDTEVFRLSKQAKRGIVTSDEKWLDEVIAEIGPGGDYLAEMSTVKGIRGGEWYINQLGVHQTYDKWTANGKPSLLDDAREKVDYILETHKPLPLGEDVERELDKIEARALSLV